MRTVHLRLPLFRLLLALIFVFSDSWAQRSSENTALASPIADDTTISLFWFGDMDSHFRQPLNFHIVSPADPRLHKVVIDHEGKVADYGWNAFISQAEMDRFVDQLRTSDFHWAFKKKREQPKDRLHRVDDSFMDLTVTSSKGTAKGYIRIARMCEELAPLDSIMPSARILWQFQLLRVDNGCVVPGFTDPEIPK